MLYTSQIEDNGVSDNHIEKLYNDPRLNAIVRFLKVRVPVYARAVGDALLVAGLEKNFETDLTINEIASNSGVSRSMTIQSLKLLVDLQIFHKQEEINKPCTYKFNPGEWLQYSTPEPKQKVVRISGEDVEAEKVEDTCGVPDTPPGVSINAYPLPINNEYVSPTYQQERPEIAAEPLFAQAHTAHLESLKPKKFTIFRNPADSASVRYAEVGPIYDEPTGLEIQRRVDEEGMLPQQVVVEAISLSKGFRFLTAIATVAGRICTNALNAITKFDEKKASRPRREKKLDNVAPIQQKKLQEEDWFRNACAVKGWISSYKDLSYDGRKYISPDGVVKLYIGELMLRYPDPSLMPSLLEIAQNLQVAI